MDILDDMRVSKLSAKVNYSFKQVPAHHALGSIKPILFHQNHCSESGVGIAIIENDQLAADMQ